MAAGWREWLYWRPMLTRVRLLIVSAVLLTFAVGPALIAQEQVTVLQRNGDRVTGRFEAWHRPSDTVYVRVSLNDQRKIPMSNVALIAVGGDAQNLPAGEVEAAQGGQHVLVTRGGEVLRGRLTNIEGGEGSETENEPRTVTFQAGNERRFRMNEIARLYVAAVPQQAVEAPAVETPPTALPAGVLAVPATTQWTPANITVRRGDRVVFTANGEIGLSAEADDRAGPAGSLKGRYAPGSPAPQFLAGALIGRIGGGAPFAIGNQTTPLTMSADGPLYLGVNDDQVSDNSGRFEVTVRVTRGR